MVKKNEKFAEYLTTEPIFGPYGFWISELSNIEKGMRLLDVGCGIGVCTFPLAKIIGSHGKVIGVDLSSQFISKAVQIAKYLQISNISFAVGNAEGLEFSENTFDRVISNFAINQVIDKLRALKEMKRVLKPGGILGFIIPGPEHFKEIFDVAESIINSERFQQRKEMLHATEAIYQSLLRSVGFVDIKVYSKIKTFHIPNLDIYNLILSSRGPKNIVLSNIPEKKRKKVWDEILNTFKKKLGENLHLALTVDAYGFAAKS
ncbi:MAG: hypothetical protein A2Y79_12150 [Deltaproteobacteria bacterium RBG_13_43_22]|jgi:ubiquinone/menaquinone biosynthesis C-methylase UbiE|nr:MAG: hypothetical protein A2Y79_12150 [Deltaproteobacteria bacterium RBG_13_43_22]